MINASSEQSLSNLSVGQTANLVFNFNLTSFFVPGTIISLPLNISSDDDDVDPIEEFSK